MQARDNPSGGVPPAHQTWIRQQTLHMCWFSAAAATAADKLLTAPSEEEVLGRFTEEELKRYKKRKWHHDVGKHTRKYKEREERRKNSLGKRNKSQREKSTAVATRRVAEVSNPGSVVTEVVCRVPTMKMSKKILYDKNGQRRLSVVPVGEQLLEFLRRVDQYAPKNSKLAQWRTVSKTNGRLFHRRPDENCQGMRWMRDLCKRVKGVPSGYFSEETCRVAEESMNSVIDHCFDEICVEPGGHQLHTSFLKTEDTEEGEQLPHVDQNPCDLVPCDTGKKCRVCGSGCICHYKDKTPYSLVMPLTHGGSYLKVWEDIPIYHGVDDAMPATPKESTIIHIPLGHVLLFRADVVHAGGFLGVAHNNLRLHGYVYPLKGWSVHPTVLKTYHNMGSRDVTRKAHENSISFSEYVGGE